MPWMDEQVRKERAERLLQLRFEEGMSPTAAWHAVEPDSKAKDPAELCRREIRWYRKKHCVVDAPGENGGLEGGDAGGPNGASHNGAAAEVAEDVATKPAKRCAGVEGQPCGKEISGRSQRCDDCRKEHERRRKQRNNRNDHRRHGEERKERELRKRLSTALRSHLARLQEEEGRRRREAEIRRQEEERIRQEEERKRREEAAAALAKIEAEAEARRKAEEERMARMQHVIEFVPGSHHIVQLPNGQRERYDFRTQRSKIL